MGADKWGLLSGGNGNTPQDRKKAHMGSEECTLSCACEILPTLVVLGVPEPLGTPAALANNTDAGGVLRMNVKLLSCASSARGCQYDTHGTCKIVACCGRNTW